MNDNSTDRPKKELQVQDTVGRALDAIEQARTTGVDRESTEAVHRRQEHGMVCEIDDAGGFTFVTGLASDAPKVVHFTPQETVELWHFWRRLGYGEIAYMLSTIEKEKSTVNATIEQGKAPDEHRALKPYACLNHSPGVDGTVGFRYVPKVRRTGDGYEVRIDGDEEGDWERVEQVVRPESQPIVILVVRDATMIMHASEFDEQLTPAR